MSREPTRRRFVTAAAAAGTVGLAGCGGDSSSGGGDTYWYYGTTNQALSQSLVAFVNDEPNRNLKLKPGGPDADAIKRLSAGGADFGILRGDVAWFAWEGDHPKFQKSLQNVRGVAAMYPIPFTFVASKDLEADSLEGLDGHRVHVGAQDGIYGRSIDLHYQLSDSEIERVRGPMAESVSMLESGDVDVGVVAGEYPDPAVQDLAPDIKVLEVDPGLKDDLTNSAGWLIDTTLPAGVYDGVDVRIPTTGVSAVLLTRSDVGGMNVASLLSAIFQNASDVKVKENYLPRQGGTDDIVRGVGPDFHNQIERRVKYGQN
jgi:TRAP transporter TAXI family solute receptor